MCELLGVEPAINNGTEASIYDLLLSPPQYPTIDPVGKVIDFVVADWSSDVRLTSSNTQTCSAYDDLKSLNVTMQPLFPNFYGSNAESSATTFIVSNSVPFNDQLSKHWNHLTENLIPSWLNGSSSGLNIII
ncbi:hypothetical protein Avbf_18720, partial [Armadillidium vulgare]